MIAGSSRRPSFYDTEDGEPRCRLCDVVRGHMATCPLVALRIQVQELGSQLGLYVLSMREVLEGVDRLLQGDRDA
jgi:hypothetical protein